MGRLRRLALLALCVGPCVTGEPLPLAEVRSVAELRAQPAIALDDGVRVRLGIESRSCAVGSGVVIYCLSEGWKGAEASDDFDLGPVRLEIQVPPSQEQLMADGLLKDLLPRHDAEPLLSVHALACRTPGVYRIAVHRRLESDVVPIEDPLAATTVEAHGDAAAPPLFALRRPDDAPELDEVEVDAGPSATLAPGLEAVRPLLPVQLAQLPGDDGQLPCFLPDPLRPDLHVTAERVDEGWLLHLRADPPLPLGDLSAHFAARFWIAGRGVRDWPLAVYHDRGGVSALIEDHASCRLLLRWDPVAHGADPGDAIEIQLFSSALGWEELAPQEELLEALIEIASTRAVRCSERILLPPAP